MIKLEVKDKEVDIQLEYFNTVGSQPCVKIHGVGDLSHHLIEGLFGILDKLSKMENCCHRAEEYTKKD